MSLCAENAVQAVQWAADPMRPAWLASMNLVAARNFLAADPPRLSSSRKALSRLVDFLESDQACWQVNHEALAKRAGIALNPELEALARQLLKVATAISPSANVSEGAEVNEIDSELREIKALMGVVCSAVGTR